MRHAYMEQEFMLDESGNVFGINLGFDFCCEHECGIEKLKELFGVTGNGFGIEARRQTKNPGTVMVHEFTRDKKKLIALICFPSKNRMPRATDKKQLSDIFVFNVGIPWEKELATAWDESSFGICTAIKNKDKVLQLKEAIENNQLVIGLGPATAFRNGGLKLLYADKIPEEIATASYDADKSRYELLDAAFEKTNIKKILTKAKKG